jgi:hypothetical protein
MEIMASARAMAILVAGLLAFLAGPSLAATDMDGSTSSSVLGENARMISGRASDPLQASPDSEAGVRGDSGTMRVAADQLNDVDRSLRESSAAPAVSANPPPAPVAAVSGEGSTWDKTSLIGKIFIGFGALLTVASAARMFMA